MTSRLAPMRRTALRLSLFAASAAIMPRAVAAQEARAAPPRPAAAAPPPPIPSVGDARAQPVLTTEEALAIVRPIHGALTASPAAELRSLLEAATRPDLRNCTTNESCEMREATIAHWSARVALVPDRCHEAREVLVSGDRVIVRGEDAGAPVGAFLGIAPNGRSFAIMTLDIHEVADGRVVRTFPAEDWMRAMR